MFERFEWLLKDFPQMWFAPFTLDEAETTVITGPVEEAGEHGVKLEGKRPACFLVGLMVVMLR